jgi:hypothetical protein
MSDLSVILCPGKGLVTILLKASHEELIDSFLRKDE